MDIKDGYILDLLEHKSYDELNANEKRYVDKTIGENAYTEQRKTIGRYNMLFEFQSEAPPLPSEVFESEEKSKSIFMLRIPMYQAAAAVLVAMIVSWFLLPKPTKEVVIEKPVVQSAYATDTVYVKEIDTVPTTVFIVRNPTSSERSLERRVVKSIDTNTQPTKVYWVEEVPVYQPSEEDVKASFGNTSTPESSLEQFRVSL